MSWNNFEIKSDIDSESLLLETDQSLKEFKQEIQDKNQYFEYKNRSKDGKWYVFSYNAITWERTDDIKQKYIDQYKYKGEKEEIIITDDKWNEILSKEFRENTKIYLKIKRNENRRPVLFINYNFSKDNDNIVCYIDADWWTPHNIRQIYQDQADKVIPEEDFLIQDGNGKTYDESARFKPWDAVIIKFKKSETSEKDSHGEKYTEEKVEENNEAEEVEEQTTEEVEEQTTEEHTQETPEEATQETAEAKISIFREMIETQWIPLSRWDRSKPEISLTFDDWYWESYIRSILDTLRWSWIKATFFVLWECVKKSRSLWEQAIKDWHEICCHTYSHAYLSEWENTEFFKLFGCEESSLSLSLRIIEKGICHLYGVGYLHHGLRNRNTAGDVKGNITRYSWKPSVDLLKSLQGLLVIKTG